MTLSIVFLYTEKFYVKNTLFVGLCMHELQFNFTWILDSFYTQFSNYGFTLIVMILIFYLLVQLLLFNYFFS